MDNIPALQHAELARVEPSAVACGLHTHAASLSTEAVNARSRAVDPECVADCALLREIECSGSVAELADEFIAFTNSVLADCGERYESYSARVAIW